MYIIYYCGKSMEDIVLKCENICKKIKQKTILNNVSLQIKSGEILGFIGPNGAGKTTTIKIILGLQQLNEGNVIINNYNIKDNYEKAIEKVGAIVENPDFYMYMSGRKNLELICNMYKGIGNARIDEVVKLVGLENRINDKVSKYSLGMRQRLGIAQALINKPNLLILDEPTNGLDPEGIKELRELLVKLAKKENMAILISSHNLLELESFVNKVCIIKNGKIVENTGINQLKEAIKENKSVYNIEVDNADDIKNVLEKYSADMEFSINDKIIKLNIEKEKIPQIIKYLVENNINIYEIKQERISLEDAFLKRTGGNVID